MTDSFYGTFKVNEIASAVDVDAIIVGAPFDDKIGIYQEGSSLAPQAIRKASQFYAGQSLQKQSIHQLNVLDYGNIQENLSFEKMTEELSAKVSEILAKKARPIILGGDHAIAFGTAKGLADAKEKIDALIWVDAHLDLMNEYPEGKKNTRATILRRIIDKKLIKPEQVYFIGPRGHNIGWEEVEFIQKNNMNLLSTKDFQDKKKYQEFLNAILKHKNIYMSVDLDVLDPAFMPGLSVPEPGGFTTRELFSLINKVAKNIRCLEIVELNPKLDLNELSAKVAAKVIYEFFDYM
ncbi:MAG: agmatinase [Candidatus Heimdallarchaeota archaeon]